MCQTLWLLEECMMYTLLWGLSPGSFSEGESAQLWLQNSEIDSIVSISGISVTQRRKPHVFHGQQTAVHLGFPFLWFTVVEHITTWMSSPLSVFDNLTLTPRPHQLTGWGWAERAAGGMDWGCRCIWCFWFRW